MPTSIDPQPGENEIECARCGAHVFMELSRCPECGVNFYEPEDEPEEDNYRRDDMQGGIFRKIGELIRRISGKPYSAEEIFGDALDQSLLYSNLLVKVGGDDHIVERLIEFEREKKPAGNRMIWLENAIQRWEKDNRIAGSMIED